MSDRATSGATNVCECGHSEMRHTHMANGDLGASGVGECADCGCGLFKRRTPDAPLCARCGEPENTHGSHAFVRDTADAPPGTAEEIYEDAKAYVRAHGTPNHPRTAADGDNWADGMRQAARIVRAEAMAASGSRLVLHHLATQLDDLAAHYPGERRSASASRPRREWKCEPYDAEQSDASRAVTYLNDIGMPGTSAERLQCAAYLCDSVLSPIRAYERERATGSAKPHDHQLSEAFRAGFMACVRGHEGPDGALRTWWKDREQQEPECMTETSSSPSSISLEASSSGSSSPNGLGVVDAERLRTIIDEEWGLQVFDSNEAMLDFLEKSLFAYRVERQKLAIASLTPVERANAKGEPVPCTSSDTGPGQPGSRAAKHSAPVSRGAEPETARETPVTAGETAPTLMVDGLAYSADDVRRLFEAARRLARVEVSDEEVAELMATPEPTVPLDKVLEDNGIKREDLHSSSPACVDCHEPLTIAKCIPCSDKTALATAAAAQEEALRLIYAANDLLSAKEPAHHTWFRDAEIFLATLTKGKE